MFRYETSSIIIIITILIVNCMQIIALPHRFKGISYKLKDEFKIQQQPNVEAEQDAFYPINKGVLEANEYGIKEDLFKDQMPCKLKYSNEDAKEMRSQILGFEDPSYDYNYSDTSDQITRRRETPSAALQNTSLYPSVLTKALEISLNTSAPMKAGSSLLSNVAQKMNTSTLELPKILTQTENSNNDDQFLKLIENYKKTKDIPHPGAATFKSTHLQNVPNNFQNLQKGFEDNSPYLEEHVEGISPSNVAAILDHVLNKLEIIQKTKEDKEEEHPDGVPCDILGSWSSATLGYCFHIQLHTDKNRYVPPAEVNNKLLSINVSECIPAKHHQLIDMEWKFSGSALKQWGGPFYLYGQKKSEATLSTFLGFCRTCHGIDTIFGSWNILSPTKDCHDVSLGNIVKQDILRRVRMESKRKERFKNLLYQSRHGRV